VLLVALAVISIVAGLLVVAIVLRWPSVDPASPRVAEPAAQTLEQEMVKHRSFRHFVAQRSNPEVATGLFLTGALAIAIFGGLLLGALAVLVRSDSGIVTIDRDISRWVADHGSQVSHDVLQAITQFGATEYVLVAAIVVLIVEYIRRPSRWIVAFLAVVLIGQSLITNGIKELFDRLRPTLNPAAHLLGPSFPSGHTATAAAFWAAVALLLGRGRGRRAHAALAGGAVAIAVAVACTRVLLDVHWFSDVIAGLALGWAWFALCSIAFGGRLLHFGAPVEAAERAVAAADASVAVGSPHPAGATVGIEHPGMEEVQERSRNP
jgi:membrane-associated phospholipid phosphatase